MAVGVEGAAALFGDGIEEARHEQHFHFAGDIFHLQDRPGLSFLVGLESHVADQASQAHLVAIVDLAAGRQFRDLRHGAPGVDPHGVGEFLQRMTADEEA